MGVSNDTREDRRGAAIEVTDDGIDVPSSMRRISVDCLSGLNEWARNTLRRGGIRTLGDLHGRAPRAIEELTNCGAKTREKVERELRTFTYPGAWGFSGPCGPVNLLVDFAEFEEDLARLELEGGRESGRDEARHTGLPSEAVREFRFLRSWISERPRLLAQSQLEAALRWHYGVDPDTAVPHLAALLQLLGCVRHEAGSLGLEPHEAGYWVTPGPEGDSEAGGAGGAVDSPEITRRASEIRALLGERVTGASLDALVADLGLDTDPATLEAVAGVLWLMPDLEFRWHLDEVIVQSRFEALPSVAERAYRILHEYGAPLAADEIAGRIDGRMAELDPTAPPCSPEALSQRLQSDDRFTTCAWSEEWILSVWAPPNAVPVVDLVYDALLGDTPLKVSEVRRYVSQHRSDILDSTIIALAEAEPGLRRLADGRIGLAAPFDGGDRPAASP